MLSCCAKLIPTDILFPVKIAQITSRTQAECRHLSLVYVITDRHESQLGFPTTNVAGPWRQFMTVLIQNSSSQ